MQTPRILRPTQSDQTPLSFISMASISRLQDPDTDLPVDLVAGAGMVWRQNAGDGIHLPRASKVSFTQAGFWAWAAGQVRAGTRIWIVAMDLYTTLVDLGFWNLVAENEWIIQAPDSWEPPLNVGRKDWRGFVCLENPPTIVQAVHAATGAGITMVDLGNYCDLSWADIGIGEVDAAWDPHRLSDIAWHMAHNVGAWFRDWIGQVRTLHLGSLQTTAASQGLYYFRRHFLGDGVSSDGPVIDLDTSPEIRRLERAGLYSGRCECRRIGHVPGPIYQLDINSCYPAIMSTLEVPIKITIHCDSEYGDSMLMLNQPENCMADCTIETESADYPLRVDGIVIWPVGTFRTVLPGPEFAHAASLGRVKAVHSYVRYDTECIFCDCVRGLYEARLQLKADGKPSLARAVNKMLHTLAGKFGQHAQSWEPAPDFPAPTPWGTWWEYVPGQANFTQYRAMGGFVQKCVVGGEKPNSFPAIPAWITSAARLRLLELIRLAGPGNVFYYDTDSLWVNGEGRRNLEGVQMFSDNRLGWLKVAGAYQEVQFLGVKNYIADGTHTCAGMSGSGTISLPETGEVFAARNGTNCARGGQSPQRRLDRLVLGGRKRYKHGCVHSDGTVEPFREGL